MLCEKCGKEIKENVKICPYCEREKKKKRNIFDIVVVSILVLWIWAAFFPSVHPVRDKARFGACREALAGLRTAEEMVMVDTQKYTNDGKLLAKQMFGEANSTQADLEQRINNSCASNAQRNNWTVSKNIRATSDAFCITGYSHTKTKYQICVSPYGISPDRIPSRHEPTACKCLDK